MTSLVVMFIKKWTFWFPLAGILLFIPAFRVANLPCTPYHAETWGFFGHRKINRLAIFTLPPELIVFYKSHIEFITEQAVAPDNRRYASPHEAPRHFIDLDRYGKYPFENLPRLWPDALLKYLDFYFVSMEGDTLPFLLKKIEEKDSVVLLHPSLTGDTLKVPGKDFRRFFKQHILPGYYDEEWLVSLESVAEFLQKDKLHCSRIFVKDHFSEHGILPYNLLQTFNRLREAFVVRDVARILRYSADIGHYIGDAHVPLHTTTNYNGQLTGQDGIHAFWESRLPELYADTSWDLWTGKANSIENPAKYFWDIVLESHLLVDSVLGIEKRLREIIPPDRRFSYVFRNNQLLPLQSQEFSEAYHRRLGGMVERRMRAAILATGSVWLTAWTEAGRPRLLPGSVSDVIEVVKDSVQVAPVQSRWWRRLRPHE